MTFSIPLFVIIADDLTGSLDTGLQFHKKGLTTYVPLKGKQSALKGQALVLNTNSRNLPGQEAYRLVYKACRNIRAKGIYKKIDSTMRGNVGQEVLAILRARRIPKAIVVPTLPVMGRAVEKGILRIHGIPLRHTPYAKDPFHPLSTSNLPDLLARETGHAVGLIGLGTVRKGPLFLAEKIENHPAQLLVLDAVSRTDLQIIAAACRSLQDRLLPCGSAGLADELITHRGPRRKDRRRRLGGPLLIISASRNPRTGEQIAEAGKSFPFPLVEPDLNVLTNPRLASREVKRISAHILPLLSRNRGVILTTTFQKHLAGQEKVIANALGKAAVLILKQKRLGGLLLTGGDLAMGVCARLAATALRIDGEVVPGIPCSSLADGPFARLPLVTKAGGFGEKDAMVRMIHYLRGNE